MSMIGVVWPLAWAALVPVIVIEAIAGRWVTAAPWKGLVLAASGANLASTLIGIPLTWFLLVLVELVTTGGFGFGLGSPVTVLVAVTLQALWLLPYQDEIVWMAPAALTFLLPFFAAASIVIERPILARLSGCERAEANRWAWCGNLLTYGIAIGASVAFLVAGVVERTSAIG